MRPKSLLHLFFSYFIAEAASDLFKFPRLHLGFFGRGRSRQNHRRDFDWHAGCRLPNENKRLRLTPPENVHALTSLPDHIASDTRFAWHRRHEHIRGHGFWYWRPLVIQWLFETGSVAEGEVLFWLDAGNELLGSGVEADSSEAEAISDCSESSEAELGAGFRADGCLSDLQFASLVRIAENYDILAIHSDYREKQWLRGAAFHAILNVSSDDPYFANSAMIPTTGFFIKNSKIVRDNFLSAWAELMARPELVRDKDMPLSLADVAGSEERFKLLQTLNWRGFTQNREQGIFSLLLKANEPEVLGQSCTMGLGNNLTQNGFHGGISGWTRNDTSLVPDSFLSRRRESGPYGFPGLRVGLVPNFLEPPHRCAAVAATRGDASADALTRQNWRQDLELDFILQSHALKTVVAEELLLSLEVPLHADRNLGCMSLLSALARATMGLKDPEALHKIRRKLRRLPQELSNLLTSNRGSIWQKVEEATTLEDLATALRSLYVWADGELCALKTRMLAGARLAFHTDSEIAVRAVSLSEEFDGLMAARIEVSVSRFPNPKKNPSLDVDDVSLREVLFDEDKEGGTTLMRELGLEKEDSSAARFLGSDNGLSSCAFFQMKSLCLVEISGISWVTFFNKTSCLGLNGFDETAIVRLPVPAEVLSLLLLLHRAALIPEEKENFFEGIGTGFKLQAWQIFLTHGMGMHEYYYPEG